MGDKIRAKATVVGRRRPRRPRRRRAAATWQPSPTWSDFPALIKPSAGGGGKGMVLVRSAADLPDALASARRTAARRVRRRHPADRALRRRPPPHRDPGPGRRPRRRRPPRRARVQPPAPPPEDHRGGARPRFVDAVTRERMGAAAVEAARAVGYVGAGTVEFIVDGTTGRLPLHGDEHPPPGRAPGHRAGHRPGPGGAPAPGRRRRAAPVHPGRGTPDRPRRRGPRLRRGPRPRLPAHRRPDPHPPRTHPPPHQAPHTPATHEPRAHRRHPLRCAPASGPSPAPGRREGVRRSSAHCTARDRSYGWTPVSWKAGSWAASSTHAVQGHRLGARPGHRPEDPGPGPGRHDRPRASPPTSRSCAPCSATRPYRRATWTPAWSNASSPTCSPRTAVPDEVLATAALAFHDTPAGQRPVGRRRRLARRPTGLDRLPPGVAGRRTRRQGPGPATRGRRGPYDSRRRSSRARPQLS